MGHPNNQGTSIIIMILIINEDQGVDKKRKEMEEGVPELQPDRDPC